MKTIGILALVAVLYLGKVLFWPSELERVQKQVATFTQVASFEKAPNPLQAMAKLASLKDQVHPDVSVDLSAYRGGAPGPTYTLKDVESYAPMYFRFVQKGQVLTADYQRMGPRNYRFTLIARGTLEGKAYDHAFLLEATWNRDWKLENVKVLAPPVSPGR